MYLYCWLYCQVSILIKQRYARRSFQTVIWESMFPVQVSGITVTSTEGTLTDTDVYAIYYVTLAKTHENSGQAHVGLLQFFYQGECFSISWTV